MLVDIFKFFVTLLRALRACSLHRDGADSWQHVPYFFLCRRKRFVIVDYLAVRLLIVQAEGF